MAEVSETVGLSEEQLAEWRRLCEGASPAPWTWQGEEEPDCREYLVSGDPDYDDRVVLWCESDYGLKDCLWVIHGETDAAGDFHIGGQDEAPNGTEHKVQDWRPSEDDAAFIAAARDAMPALIAEVERLRAENDRLRFYGDNAPALVEERDATIARLRKELRVLNQQREAHQRRMGEVL